jgi:methionyl aminopeptidase
MRGAGRPAAELLDMVEAQIRAGLTTADIDRMVDEATRARGAISAPYRYHGFPGHCCTSINDVVCHGIPDPQRILREGDIINVDVTPIVAGFHGDASRTFMIGAVSAAAERLVRDTYRALWKGISAVRPGGTTGDIGHAIQSFVEPRGYSVVRQFSGHGIGRIFHTAPAILHYGRPGAGERLTPGMTFTIEPMINLGDWRYQISRGRLDGGDHRRIAVSAVRAYGAGDRVRRRGAHARHQRSTTDRPLAPPDRTPLLAKAPAAGSTAAAVLPAEQRRPMQTAGSRTPSAHRRSWAGGAWVAVRSSSFPSCVGHQDRHHEHDDHDAPDRRRNDVDQVVGRRRATGRHGGGHHHGHDQRQHHYQASHHLHPSIAIDALLSSSLWHRRRFRKSFVGA